MNFVRNLVGGLVIMLVATAIGVAQNTVRSRPLTLVAKPAPRTDAERPQSVTRSGEVDEPGDDGVTEATEPANLDAAGPPEVTEAEYASGEVSVARARTLWEAGVLIIDARSESEYVEGHIPGAVNIPYEKFVDYYENLVDYVSMDGPVIVYCRSVTCDLSDQLAQELRLMGYERVVLYRGGWDAWTEAGFPTETGDPEQ